jgi:hypothetical protein
MAVVVMLHAVFYAFSESKNHPRKGGIVAERQWRMGDGKWEIVPVGTFGNSPAFQRREQCEEGKVPKGRPNVILIICEN